MTKSTGAGRGGHNKARIDEAELIREYERDKQAIVKLAAKYSVSIQTLYSRLETLGIAGSLSAHAPPYDYR